MKKLKLFSAVLFVIFLISILTACTQGVQVTITFDSNGGSDVAPITVNMGGISTDGDSIKIPDDPEKDGYHFDGWYWDNETFNKRFTVRSLMDSPIQGNLTVYAKWRPEGALTPDQLGGTEILTDIFVIEDNNLTLNVAKEVNTFSFINHIQVNPSSKWSLSTDISGNQVIATKTVELTADENIFYILVEAENKDIALYTVTITKTDDIASSLVNFYVDSEVYETINVAENSLISPPEIDPAKIGYTFDGWDYDFSVAITEDTDIYAKWLLIDYQINYFLNGGINSEDNPSVYTIESSAISLVAPVREGYMFLGWYVNAEFSGDTVSSIETGSTGNKDFYAKWNNESVITFNKAGGTGGTCEVNAIYGSPMPQALAPTREGYVFNGYFLLIDENEIQYYDHNMTSVRNWDMFEDVTLIADWTDLILDFEYEILNNGTAEIKRYLGNSSEVILPDTYLEMPITSIGTRAFLHKNVTTITISKNISNITDLSLNGCALLENIYVDSENQFFTSVDGILYSKDMTVLVKCPIGNTQTDFVFSNTLEYIKPYAFLQCSNIVSVVIPENVNNIGSFALEWCSNLVSVTLLRMTPPEIILASDGNLYLPFANNNSNMKIYVPNASINVYKQASKWNFYNTVYQSISSPITFEKQGGTGGTDTVDAFYGSEMPIAVAPSKDDYVFEGYYLIDENNNEIMYYNGDMNSARVCDFYSGITLTAKWSIAPTDFEYQLLSNDTYEIISYSGDSQHIIIPDTYLGKAVTAIGSNAFSDCSQLISVAIPNSITVIGTSAFYNCNSLSSLILPQSLTTIGHYAFNKCVSLSYITIPANVVTIGTNAFLNCEGLIDIYVDSANTSFSSYDGVLYNNDKTTLISYPAANSRTSFSIFPAVTKISNNAFWHATSLETINLPNGLSEIGVSAFAGCSGIQEIQIPASVSRIGALSFASCTNLRRAYLYCNTVPTVMTQMMINQVFNNNSSSFGIYVLNSLLNSYKQSDAWSGYTNILFPISFIVTFDKMGGTGGSNSVIALYGSPMPSASAPIKSGYIFTGYYLNNLRIYNPDMTSSHIWNISDSSVLYARWVVASTTTSSNISYVSPEIKDISHWYSAQITLQVIRVPQELEFWYNVNMLKISISITAKAGAQSSGNAYSKSFIQATLIGGQWHDVAVSPQSVGGGYSAFTPRWGNWVYSTETRTIINNYTVNAMQMDLRYRYYNQNNASLVSAAKLSAEIISYTITYSVQGQTPVSATDDGIGFEINSLLNENSEMLIDNKFMNCTLAV